MFLFLIVTIFISLIEVDCNTIIERGSNLPMVILDGSNPIITTTYNFEKKSVNSRCSTFSPEIYLDNDRKSADLRDVKLEVVSSRKINYIKNNITSDYFSETADDDYPEFSKVENFLENLKANEQDVFCDDFEKLTLTTQRKPEINTQFGGQTQFAGKSYGMEYSSVDSDSGILRSDIDFIPLCTSHIDNIKPRKIRNIKGDLVRVVNYEEYEQIMLVEVCGESLGTACGSYAKLFPNGLKPICRQHYIYRKTAIFAQNPKDPDKPIEFEYIPIPASCVCDLRDMSLT